MASMRWWEVEAVVEISAANDIIDGGNLEAPVRVSNESEILTDGTFDGDLQASTKIAGRLEVNE